MTEHNLFQEVQEDLQRQRLEDLWKNYGGWVIAMALAVVLTTAGGTAYRSWKMDRDQHVTEAFLTASKPDADAAKSLAALEKFAADHSGSDAADLALLHAGALAVDANDKTKAIQIFDSVAADSKADPAFRQLADLLSVQTQMDSGDAALLLVRLQPLTAEKAPWRFSALEDSGYLALRAGDAAKAKQIFTDLSQDARAPQSIATRAADLLRSLN